MAMQLVVFVLGALFTFALQFLTARLGLLREKARESWIRRLNSYQDFSTATVGLVELWQTGATIPDAEVWKAIAQARKAAYDAALYDEARTHLTSRMRAMSTDLVRFASESTPDQAELQSVIDDARAIWDEFTASERALREAAGPRWLGR